MDHITAKHLRNLFIEECMNTPKEHVLLIEQYKIVIAALGRIEHMH